jgi:hypothetical protein
MAGRGAGLWKKLYGEEFTGLPDLMSTENVSEVKELLSADLCSIGGNASERSVSLAASKFLARKLLPSKPGNGVQSYHEKLMEEPTIDPVFAREASKLVTLLFPTGWDADIDYQGYCDRVVVSDSSCLEASTKKGGARTFLASKISRESFVRACKTGEGFVRIPSTRKVVEVETGGKTRIVTIASAWQHQLKPLHSCLYDQLAKRKFILKGDAKVSSLSNFQRERTAHDEVFVSGDYESATDNFNGAHSQLLVDLIRKQSTVIPEIVWDEAMDFLTSTLVSDLMESPQLTGQLMGNLLSFPLLCLTNLVGVFIGFRDHKRVWGIIKAGLLKINGDDIVFRSTLAEANRWMIGVAKCGLKLSRGKTLVHKRFFSINSTFFRVQFDQRPKLIPVLRPSSIWAADKTVLSMGGMVASAAWGWKGSKRDEVIGEVLRRFRSTLLREGYLCSVSRGMGIDVTVPALGKALLLKREHRMLHLPAQMDRMPKAVLLTRGEEPGSWDEVQKAIKGFHSVPVRSVPADKRKEYEESFSRACVEHAWGLGTVGKVKREIRASLRDRFNPKSHILYKMVVKGETPGLSLEQRAKNSALPVRVRYSENASRGDVRWLRERIRKKVVEPRMMVPLVSRARDESGVSESAEEIVDDEWVEDREDEEEIPDDLNYSSSCGLGINFSEMQRRTTAAIHSSRVPSIKDARSAFKSSGLLVSSV